MKAKIKVRLVCKDGIVRTYRMLRSNFFKKLKEKSLVKISFDKKRKRFVWRKTKIPKVEKILKKKAKKLKEKEVEKFYKVNAKVTYERQDKPYKNFYLDAYSYFRAKSEEEAKEKMRKLILTEFPNFDEYIEFKVREVKLEEIETFGELLYRHSKTEKWKLRRLDTYV